MAWQSQAALPSQAELCLLCCIMPACGADAESVRLCVYFIAYIVYTRINNLCVYIRATKRPQIGRLPKSRNITPSIIISHGKMTFIFMNVLYAVSVELAVFIVLLTIKSLGKLSSSFTMSPAPNWDPPKMGWPWYLCLRLPFGMCQKMVLWKRDEDGQVSSPVCHLQQ